MTIDRLPLVTVPRRTFEEGRAECVICGAFVRAAGSMTQMLVRRRFGQSAAAGECSVCQLVTYFALEGPSEARDAS